MNLPGLHHQIAMKRMAAGELARQARRVECDPRTAYEKGVEAEKLAVESETLCEHLKGNLEAMDQIRKVLNYLGQSKFKSRHRAIAVTELENAFARLLLENGEPEAEAKFEALPLPAPTPKPINGKKKA